MNVQLFNYHTAGTQVLTRQTSGNPVTSHTEASGSTTSKVICYSWNAGSCIAVNSGCLSILHVAGLVAIIVYIYIYIEGERQRERERETERENTSWKVLAYSIYARVVEKKNDECVNTVQSTFHVVLCLLHTY